MKNKKMSNAQIKRHTKIVIFSVICLLIITISYSYSAYFSIRTNQANQSIKTGGLTVSLSGTALTLDNIDFENLNVVNDSKRRFTTTLSNSGNITANYYMTVSYDLTSAMASSPLDPKKIMPLEYISGGIEVCGTSGCTNTGLTSNIFNIGDLPITEGTGSSYNSEYKIWEGTINAGSTQTFSMIFYMPNSFNEQEYISEFPVHLKLKVHATVKDAEQTYTLSGKLKDDSGTILSNKKIYLSNGAYQATTDSNGNFSITGLRKGVYNVATGSTLYATPLGIIDITEDKTQPTSCTSITSVQTDNTSILDAAKSGPTTINGFKSANSITTDSIRTKLTISSIHDISGTNRINVNSNSNTTISGLTFQGSTEYSLVVSSS